VELRGVGFAYPESTAPVLDDVTFTLRAGTVTALVGHNGAGKSTVVKLLTRMYGPTCGEILLDGHPLAEYDLGALRGRSGVVFQDFARFALSLRENIDVAAGGAAMADDGRPATAAGDGVADRRVEEAACLAGVDEVAATLPRGYETELTRQFEGGVELSGGQWQKVAVARAFLRDAALVILDEPTSALDAEAEHRLIERFREITRGRTALIISHRLSTVRQADHIVVLDAGRIVEQGSHDALIARGGVYAALFEMQAGRYRERR
jgi:ATP-binding cassette subfamily B protein